jgi:CheY-like chemotaxis protein
MARVLVLDDNADLRELLGELLTLSSASCVTAGTLKELEAKEREAVACDLAILDINLGENEPTGVDACRWLHAHGFGGEIVFLTGHAASDPRVREAAAMTQARVLTKPLEAARLTELLATAAGVRR